MPSSPWKQRARSSLPLASDGTRAGDHDVWSLWLPPGNSSPARPLLPPPKPLVGSPARPVPPPLHGRQRLLQGGRKKQAIDLGASVSLGGGMFGAIVPVQLTYAAEGSNPRVAGGVPGRPATHTRVRLALDRCVGTARLCFLADNAFVGVAELELGGRVLVPVQLTGTEAAEECDREMCGADDCCGDVAFGVQVARSSSSSSDPSRVACESYSV